MSQNVKDAKDNFSDTERQRVTQEQILVLGGWKSVNCKA